MQQNGFHDDADAAQQEKHDGQLLQTLSADVRGEEPGQPGGAEGGGQRDKAEAQGGAVQEPGAEIQPGAEQVFTQKEEANAISAIYIETGEFLKTGVFVDLNNGTIFSADIPAEGIYNKKGKLISDDVLENGDKVKIYGDGIMLESFPGQYPGVTKIQRTGRASLEETQEYEDKVNELMKPVAVQ